MATSAPPRARACLRPRRPRRFVPRLEGLEDRTVPDGLSLLGHSDLGGAGFNADVWGHGNYAYVGTWGRAHLVPDRPELCPGTGVKIVDISDPADPRQVATAAGYPLTSAEDVMVERIDTSFFHGDLLAVGIQRCVPFGQGVEGGLDLWDVSDPRQPVHLSFFSVGEGAGPARGVHELYLLRRGNRAYALLADSGAEADTFIRGLPNRGLDFKIVDVTDPRNPVLASQWGAFTGLGIPLGPHLEDGLLRTGFGHSVSVNEAGTVAFVSYWDTGMVLLDISDPANPRYLGRSLYGPTDDGEGHSAIPVPGNRLAVVTDEDWSPIDSGPPGTRFPGWGYARIYDIADPAQPVQVGTFATPNSLTDRTDGFYSVHNPVVRGRTLYLSWYSDGLRVVDISRPSAPREIASFVPPPHPDPMGFELPGQAFTFVWGVWVGGDTILLSDINSGLYVLRQGPASGPGRGAGPDAAAIDTGASGARAAQRGEAGLPSDVVAALLGAPLDLGLPNPIALGPADPARLPDPAVTSWLAGSDVGQALATGAAPRGPAGAPPAEPLALVFPAASDSSLYGAPGEDLALALVR